MQYEVWGIGYDAKGMYTEYMKKYGEFDEPAAALLFANEIDANWLKEHGELKNEALVDVCVEGAYEDGQLAGEESLYIHRIEIFHKMNFGLQSA